MPKNPLREKLYVSVHCLCYRDEDAFQLYRSGGVHNTFGGELEYPVNIQHHVWNQMECDYPDRIHEPFEIISDTVDKLN